MLNVEGNTIQIRVKYPDTLKKYLHLLYTVDVLSGIQIAFLLGLSEFTVQKYLTILKKMKCIINVQCKGSHYWHLLPIGVMVYEKLIGRSLPTYQTTVTQGMNSKGNQNTSHNVHCSNALMALVKSSVEGGCGLWEAYGPTFTRTLYMIQRTGETFKRTTYNPDAYISFYAGKMYGRMYLEYESGIQYAETLTSKVRKAHAALNLSKEDTSDIVIGFITKGGEQKKRNMITSMKEYTKNHTHPLTVVVACYQDILSGNGWDKIWHSNKSKDQLSFADLGFYKWEDEGSPELIGFSDWRKSMLEDI